MGLSIHECESRGMARCVHRVCVCLCEYICVGVYMCVGVALSIDGWSFLETQRWAFLLALRWILIFGFDFFYIHDFFITNHGYNMLVKIICVKLQSRREVFSQSFPPYL